MSADAPDPLPPELAELLRDERARPLPRDLDPDALLARIEADLEPPPSASAASPSDARPASSTSAASLATPAAAKGVALAASFALGALAGGGAVTALRAPRVVERRVEVPVERVVERRVEVPVERVVERPAAPPSRDTAVGPSAIEREVALVDQATAALARGRYDAVIATAREHLRRFPAGAMAEDRERLWIEALARAGRGAEARARATEFLRRYPASVHRARVERALGSP